MVIKYECKCERCKKQYSFKGDGIYSNNLFDTELCPDCMALRDAMYSAFYYALHDSPEEKKELKLRDDMALSVMYAMNNKSFDSRLIKFKNENYIKTEEREMKNVNETKNQNHAFAIERNYDETDRKLFRLEDAETGDFIRLATDEERLIYMVVNIAPVKSRVKVNEKSGSNGVWCVCIQTQDLVELPLSEMVYVYDPRYIAFRIGRFIDV